MAIKSIELPLRAMEAADPPAVGVPLILPGQVFASGYYTDEATGQVYYYDAVNDQWYYVSATGLLYALSISWHASPSPMIDLIGGVDTLRFNLTFRYMGPKVDQMFYAAVGDNKMSGTFAEWDGWQVRKELHIPAHDTPTLITGEYIDVPIQTGHSGDDLAAYCKKDQLIVVEGEDTTPYYYNVGHVVEAEGEFTNMKITKFEKV